jgi:hypothetical protein
MYARTYSRASISFIISALKRSTEPAYSIGKRVFALWRNDGGQFDCSWVESNGVFKGLKPSHRWSSLASAALYWFQESDMVFWRST